MSDRRELDLVVFGATGFTGGLIARYLGRSGGDARWAIAARNRAKLGRLRSELESHGIHPSGEIVADSADPESLRAMAARAQVVLTTVGPYVQYGEPLLEACIAERTDYVDLTGEPVFVNQMLARHGAAAEAAGVRIVNCCGFDSIPHDLGAWLAATQLPDDEAITIEGFVHASGSPSGGTWQSAIGALADLRNPDADREVVAPSGRRVGNTPQRIRWHDELRAWVCPFPTIDPQIIRRSAAAMPEYGPDFRYGHFARVDWLPVLVGGLVGIGAVALAAQIPPLRSLLLRARRSGAGPSEETRARSRFEVVMLGRAGEHRVRVAVHGGDPGYDETAKMASEAALCLALDRDELPARSGILTPAAAMADRLYHRLLAAGIGFEVG